MKNLSLTLLLMISFSSVLIAQMPDSSAISKEPAEKSSMFQKRSFMLYTDEDYSPILQFSGADDRNYTMGFGLGYSGPNVYQSNLMYPLRKLAGALNDEWGANTTVNWKRDLPASISLNGTAFTPDELRDVIPNKADRPYAFLLSLSTRYSVLSLNKQTPRLVTLEVAYGVLGTKIGQAVQTAIHRGMNDGNMHEPYLPMGWDTQISKGGEPTLLVSMKQDFLITKNAYLNDLAGRRVKRFNFELKAGYQGMIGWYSAANGNLSARVGLLDPRNWIQNLNLLGAVDKAAGSKTIDRNSKMEVYLYGQLRPTLMLYNELLQGGFRNSVHTMHFSQLNHLILEWNSGLGINLPGKNYTTNIIWALNSGRTAEFNTEMKRSHMWGSIYLTFSY